MLWKCIYSVCQQVSITLRSAYTMRSRFQSSLLKFEFWIVHFFFDGMPCGYLYCFSNGVMSFIIMGIVQPVGSSSQTLVSRERKRLLAISWATSFDSLGQCSVLTSEKPVARMVQSWNIYYSIAIMFKCNFSIFNPLSVQLIS